KWEAAEDVALMSAYVMVSEDATRSKNQKRESLWARVRKCYDETRAENPERLGKGKFLEYVVFNEVMCKHPKWDLQLSRDTTRTRPECEEDNEESGGSSKRSRTTESAKKKGKGEVSNEVVEELRALRHARDASCDVSGAGDGEKSSESSDSSNLSEYDEWEARFIQQNRQTDEIISELLINMPEMIIRDRPHTTRRRYYDREREMGEKRLMQDYFVDRPTYDEATFRNRFCMRRPLFLRIVDVVTANDVYFKQRRDCTGRKEYLRKPNENDLSRLLHVGEERGFPGMIGSIDCMHWQWKNCPTAWAGQYAGRSGKPTIILEAIASYDLWIWHAFFGTPGSCNDINVLHRSPLFDDILSGRAPNQQEAVKKDVERALGVLQAWFAFLRHPCLVWDKEMMGKVMSACIIIHNMIVEDKRDTYLHHYDPSEFLNSSTEVDEHAQFSMERIADLSQYMTNRAQLHNRETHNVLKNDLIEHVWQNRSNDE
nr:hypothetical protein [Tanacetum cinerariifolium]